jgi:hypothetical protein
VVLAAWLASSLFGTDRKPLAVVGLRTFLPLAVVLGLAAAATAVYDQRVTGSPWRLPYQLHQEQYAAVPVLSFQPRPALPEFHNDPIRSLSVEYEGGEYARHRTVWGWITLVLERIASHQAFLLGPFLSVPLLALPLAWRDRSTSWLLAVTCANLVATLLSTFAFPHFMGPAAPALLALVIVSLHAFDTRTTIRLRQGDEEGRPLPVARSAGALLAVTLVASAVVADAGEFVSRRVPSRWSNVRASIEQELASRRGRSLVLVSYGPAHSIHEEWVWNGADPAAARVLWARSRDRESDAKFRALWPDRTCVLLHVEGAPADVPTPRLAPCQVESP